MIRITKIEFENYRQYKSITIDFPKNKECDLHVLRAKNGTGKTTLLNGILWCLYGTEHYLSDKDKALPPVNNALLQKAQPKDCITVTVRLTLNNDENIIVFERTQQFHITVNPIYMQRNVQTSTSKLKIIETPLEDGSNSQVYEDEAEVESIVKQYFDEAIYDYYFFDGENLKNYFTKEKSEKIKKSIFNIAQVTLLSNASNHVRSMAEEKNRQAAKMGQGNSVGLLDEIKDLEKKIEDLVAENIAIEQKIPELKQRIANADATLQGYSPIRLNIEKRTILDKELKSLKSEYASFTTDKNVFITNYFTLLNFYPRAKFALDLIQKKQDSGTLPPNIDKAQVQALLNEHAKNCPVCNGALDDKAITHLQKILSELDVSSSTSNFLMEIKGGLETIVYKCKHFQEEYDKIKKQDKYYKSTIEEKQNELDNISAFLSSYADETGSSFDVKKVEVDRKQALDERIACEKRLALNQSDLARHQDTLAKKKSEIEEIETKQQKKDLLSKQVATFRSLSSYYDQVQRLIMDEIKDDIQTQTWNRFDAMIWKKNTFGGISINDKYELTVHDKESNQMTGCLGATEQMALAYSFTLAIHDASGKNCPLVVDSPLGRVSDLNRENMAGELLKVSKQKQIIMLFTPDEYSSEVKNIYDSQASTIRDITLSDDEQQIEKIGGGTNA